MPHSTRAYAFEAKVGAWAFAVSEAMTGCNRVFLLVLDQHGAARNLLFEEKTIPPPTSNSWRDFLRTAGGAVVGSALAAPVVNRVHAAEDNTIRLALIGCGGRGGGAAANALSTTELPIKLHAMADIFADKLSRSHQALSSQFAGQVDVPPERRFSGFDGYRHAIDSLRPGDIALLTTNAYCRPTRLDYAVDKGVHLFMEKSFAPDPAGLHRMLRAGKRAQHKNLKIAGGLMCRHSVARQEFIAKARDGKLGEIQFIRAYRMVASAYQFEFSPDVDQLSFDSPAPVCADAQGRYPVPIPGSSAF